MQTSRIKTCFHIVGAGCFIFGGLLILIALDQGDTASLIPLVIGGVMLAVSFYCLAGAPQLSRAVRQRFSNLEPLKKQPREPRHKAKAIIGMTTGVAMGITPFFIAMMGLLPKNISEDTNTTEDVLLLLMFFGPILSVWGAAHWAWHKGATPKIPILVGGVCFLLFSPLGLTHNVAVIVVGYTLLTLSPALVVLLANRSPRRSRNH